MAKIKQENQNIIELKGVKKSYDGAVVANVNFGIKKGAPFGGAFLRKTLSSLIPWKSWRRLPPEACYKHGKRIHALRRQT